MTTVLRLIIKIIVNEYGLIFKIIIAVLKNKNISLKNIFKKQFKKKEELLLYQIQEI